LTKTAQEAGMLEKKGEGESRDLPEQTVSRGGRLVLGDGVISFLLEGRGPPAYLGLLDYTIGKKEGKDSRREGKGLRETKNSQPKN